MKYLVSILLAAILLTSCKNQKPTERLSKNNLSAQVEYGEKMVTKTVFQSDYKMILFALKKGQDLKPHSANMDAPLIMLEGSATVTIGVVEIILEEGDIITLPKDQMHGVYPITNCKFLLVK